MANVNLDPQKPKRLKSGNSVGSSNLEMEKWDTHTLCSVV